MNMEKGLSRIAKSFGWIGLTLAAISLFTGAAILFGDASDKTMMFFAAIVIAAICYGIGSLIRWLIEGFIDGDITQAKDERPSFNFRRALKEAFATTRTRRTLVAFILFGLTCTIPIVYEHEAPDGGINAAYLIGYMVGLGSIVVVIGLMMTKRSSLGRANLLLVIATISTVWISASCYKEWGAHNKLKNSLKDLASISKEAAPTNTEDITPTSARHVLPGEEPASLTVPGYQATGMSDTADFLSSMAQHIKSQTAKMVALNRRFASADLALDSVLAPDNFLDGTHLQNSRKRLQKFEALIHQRQKLISDYVIRSEEIIRTAKLSDQQRTLTLREFNISLPKSQESYKRLDDIQLNTVKTANTILDLAQRGMGKNEVENNRILFTTQADLDVYNAAIVKIRELALDEQKALEVIGTLADKARTDIQQLTEGMQ